MLDNKNKKRHFCFVLYSLIRIFAGCMRILALLCVLVLTAFADVRAQGHGLLKRLTTENGLPSNTVRNIVQDGNGFIWLGTDNGLCRYDGSEARQYRIAENGADQFITALQVRGDSLLAGTQRGVFCLSLRTEKWHKLQGVTLKQTGREDRLTASDGRLWTGTWEQGLNVTKNGKTQRVLSPQEDHMGTHIHKLLEYDKRTLLIGCEEGLVAYDLPSSKATLWDAPKFVYSLMRDHEGGLWAGTFYDGVYYLSHTAHRFEHQSGHVISRFCEDGKGRLWVASDDAGLRCMAGGQWIDYEGSATLGKANVHALQVVRREGGEDLWVGTYSRGVYRLTGTTLRSYTDADGLYDSSSYVIYQDRRGRLWVGTMGGLCRYDETSDRFVQVGRTDGMPISICSDAKSQRLWIATQGGGLYSYDGSQWKQYRHVDDKGSLADDQVNCVVMTTDGSLWVGTERGLCLYQPKTDNFRQVLEMPVTGIVAEEKSQVLWLSTPRGVMRFEVKTGETMLMNREDGLQSLQFQPNTGFRDSHGAIYFGTINGFCRFQPRNIVTNTLRPRVKITGLEVYNREVSVGDERLPSPLTTHPTAVTLNYGDRMFTLKFASLSYMSPSKNQYAYRLDGVDTVWHYIGAQTKATFTNLPAGKYTFRVKATNNDGLWSSEEATLTLTIKPSVWWSWPMWLLYVLLIGAVVWLVIRRRHSHRDQQSDVSSFENASAPVAATNGAHSRGLIPDQNLPEGGDQKSGADREFMNRLNELIEQHYSNPDLNVSFLAERMAVSRSGLFAKAKQLADITPNEMIQTVRLNHAAQLLREGGYTVSEVCYRVGFSSPSYFTKCFQKQFGIKPTEWKN